MSVGYHEFRLPIPVRIVSGNDPRQPLGRALAYGIFLTGIDSHTIWHVCFNDGGQWWEIQNPHVRGESNITLGRHLEAVKQDNVPVRGLSALSGWLPAEAQGECMDVRYTDTSAVQPGRTDVDP